MASPVTEHGCFSDVRKVGYLRKLKSMHKRFFVLRIATVSGPSRLEYYENEKKWNQKSGAPKRSILLHNCFNINKRVDSRNKYLIALYTKDEYFAVAADSEQEQYLWYEALVDLHNRGKINAPFGNSITGEDYGETTPGPAFKEVWQVILKPKGLGQIKNLVGIYRLCLTNKTISFVKLNSDAAAVVLQLMNIRRCGHSENFFFIEVGRSAVTGPGEFWMQVDDSVVAQNMHETILEAMKAMSEEFRPRSKSQSSSNCSKPISVPLRRHHHNNPPPSQVGLSRRSRAESLTAGSPAFSGKHGHSFRVRASSDGEGTMSRPASVDGSPGSLITARTRPHCPRGSSRLHPPLSHSRSTPMPTACCSPSATSPVSLSSSSTSGHGSTSDGLYPHRSSTSVSGSPSDGDFISSDEYGSSPCDFRGSFHSVTPDSIEHTPPAREEELNSYICMATTGLQLNGYSGHVQSCCSESCTAEPEKGFRKRTHSSGALVKTACYQKNPSQDSAGSYTVMMPMHQCIRMPIDRQSAFVATDSYPEQDLNLQTDASAIGHKDDGYMPMSPGMVPQPSKSNEYMPMSPRNVSAPQQIISPHPVSIMDSDGYMMMSPSGSCSPETKYSKIWTNGTNPKLSVESNDGEVAYGDYMNMYPASYSSKSTLADCCFHQLEEPHNPLNSYHSLPRSFRHGDRQHHQTPQPLSVISVQLEESSSASSDSLGGGNGGQQVVTPTKVEFLGQPKRPTRLILENCKASTLPRARENTFPNEPKSPGEYVHIEFSDQSSTVSLVSLLPVCLDSSCERSEQQSSEYMNTELGSGSNLSRSDIILASADQSTIVEAPSLSVIGSDDLQSCDYVSMQLRSTCVNHTAEHLILRNPKMGGSAPEAPPNILSSRHEGIALNGFPGMVNQTSGLGAFTRVTSRPNQKQGTTVIRVDPQGRRRHSSETFSSTAVSCGLMSPFSMQNGKCHGSASFENVWLKPCELAAQEKNGMSCETGPSPQDSLNYIYLDLLKDQNLLEFNSQITKPLDSQNGNNSDLNMYASITFEK